LVNFKKVIAFVASLNGVFDITSGGIRVGVVLFNDAPVTAFNLNTYTNRTAIIAAINALTFIGGGTNTAGALNYTLLNALTAANGDVSSRPNVVVLMASGPSNNIPQTLIAARALRTSG